MLKVLAHTATGYGILRSFSNAKTKQQAELDTQTDIFITCKLPGLDHVYLIVCIQVYYTFTVVLANKAEMQHVLDLEATILNIILNHNRWSQWKFWGKISDHQVFFLNNFFSPQHSELWITGYMAQPLPWMLQARVDTMNSQLSINQHLYHFISKTGEQNSNLALRLVCLCLQLIFIAAAVVAQAVGTLQKLTLQIIDV